MPAAEPLPTIPQLLNAYQGGLVSERNQGDTHDGAIHDHWAGVGAILWRREAERDREEFRALYFDDAAGDRLDAYIDWRFPGKSRVRAARGAGLVQLIRPNAAAGEGTFWKGTRIAVGAGSAEPMRHYLLARSSLAGAGDLTATLAITADRDGPGSEISVSAGTRSVLQLADPLWDNSWMVAGLTCGAGSLREDDDAAKVRLRRERFAERLGYEAAIIQAMQGAGAGTVALFRADYLGEAADFGLNRVYVGDGNYETTATLLRDCRLALPAVAMAGSSTQVLALTNQLLTFQIAIQFWDIPEKFDTVSAVESTRLAVVEYFRTRENPFVWSTAGLIGAIQRVVTDTFDIEITSNVPAPILATLFNTYPLPRFGTRVNDITVSLEMPA